MVKCFWKVCSHSTGHFFTQLLLLLTAKCISAAVIKITHDSRKLLIKVYAIILRIYELRSVLNFVNLKCQVAEICSMRSYYSWYCYDAAVQAVEFIYSSTKGWFDEFDTNVISVFDIFACNFSENWATETCFTSNEQLKPLLFG